MRPKTLFYYINAPDKKDYPFLAHEEHQPSAVTFFPSANGIWQGPALKIHIKNKTCPSSASFSK